jgi:Amt family ammonium transporter
MSPKLLLSLAASAVFLTAFSTGLIAQDAAPAVAAAAAEAAPAAPEPASLVDVDTLWVCLAAFLVFWMQAGFALVETGLTRAKNAGNICMKNLMNFCIGTVTFWAVGFGLMFGLNESGYIGTTNFLYDTGDSFQWGFFIFQTVFCATAATIVSGAMAERTKFSSYLIYSIGLTLVVYPIFGSWVWNGLAKSGGAGWLEGLGFRDFAGSTVVHSIGGWAALAGALTVGPRIGKYLEGKPRPIPGHNLPIAILGVFILWLGWFGFNPGSTTAIKGGSFAYIAVTTNASAAAGAITALITTWIWFGKPDISYTGNGVLAGLVGITAGCDCVSVPSAFLIGAIAGVLVVVACTLIDRIGIDDPVGAIGVHGCCGAFGTIAVGLFMKPGIVEGKAGLLMGGGMSQLLPQLYGVGAAFLWSFGVSFAMFQAIKYTIGIRVSAEEEIEGLDIHEHGSLAYPPMFVADELVAGMSDGSPATATFSGYKSRVALSDPASA